MSTELSKNLVCICMRGGIEIWVEQDRSENMVAMLTGQNPPQFMKYENRLINRADVVGIFTASDMEEHTRRKNGEWRCGKGEWHERGIKCACLSKEWAEKQKKSAEEFYGRHGYYPAK